MKVLSKQRNSRMCFICGMDNPIGLCAQFYNMEDGSVASPILFKPEHQSFPFRVHGGLAATVQDELGLRAIWAQKGEDTFGVTMSFEVKFRKPVPYDEPLIARGILVRETPRFAVIETTLCDLNGSTLSNAELKYILLPVEKIAADANAHEEMCYLIKDNVTSLDIR
ncbi:MAG: PaaI family thioesterase [Clostridiales bacterium]|nr:PaaI family thioesterase [Clostridiales bacterium]